MGKWGKILEVLNGIITPMFASWIVTLLTIKITLIIMLMGACEKLSVKAICDRIKTQEALLLWVDREKHT